MAAGVTVGTILRSRIVAAKPDSIGTLLCATLYICSLFVFVSMYKFFNAVILRDDYRMISNTLLTLMHIVLSNDSNIFDFSSKLALQIINCQVKYHV